MARITHNITKRLYAQNKRITGDFIFVVEMFPKKGNK